MAKQIALIGAGRIGKVHAIAIDSVAGAQIKYVCDVHKPSATALATQCNATVTDVNQVFADDTVCLLYTSPSPRDQRGSRMPSSA